MDDYYKEWKILRGRILKETGGRQPLFSSPSEYREWVNGMANLGLATALRNRDQWDETRGNLNTFIFLQTRPLLRTALKREERYFKAKSEIVKEPVPQRADLLTTLCQREELGQALEQMSPDQQEAIALFYLAELSPSDIGRIMERDRNAVDALLFRARRRLKELIPDEMSRAQASPSPSALERKQRPRARSHLGVAGDGDPPDHRSGGPFQIIEGGRR